MSVSYTHLDVYKRQVIDGVPAGTEISLENIMLHMRRRAPGRPGTTPRAETDIPEFLSGIFNGRATGAPICLIIRNQNTRSGDYEPVSYTHLDVYKRQQSAFS